MTGALAGLILAGVIYPAAWLVWGDGRMAATVSIALFGACVIATMVGVALPWALHRWGKDPAFSTGPVSTVIQDFLSILVYLVTAKLLAA